MRIEPTRLAEVLLIRPQVFGDERGFFMELYRRDKFAEQGVEATFVQDNYSRSRHGALRGLHYQHPRAQGKYARVTRGAVFDVAVDIRVGSPTFGEWVGHELSEDNKLALYVPPGFAHGFCVLSETADFMYKCTDFYAPDCERGIRWDDPDIGIDWPVDAPVLSARDLSLIHI